MGSNRLTGAAEKLDPINVRALLSSMAACPTQKELARRHLMAIFLMSGADAEIAAIIDSNFALAQGQLLQDLFALSATEWMHGGVFVEVGVGDGKHLSNTYLLEKQFGWTGLLAEPNPEFHSSILSCRDAQLERRAIYDEPDLELKFVIDSSHGELSSLEKFSTADGRERVGREISVRTARLDDTLTQAGISRIDYLSVDTEGSEVEVLESVDLALFSPRAITVEHNFEASKSARIDRKLGGLGYKRVLEGRTFFDAWYIVA